MPSWTKCHQELWPTVDPPALLKPLASRADADAGQQVQNQPGHFVESTLPTSYVWASLVSQCTATKRTASARHNSMEMFHELLMKVCATGNLELSLTCGGGDRIVKVGAAGNFAVDVLLGHLSPFELEEVRNAWLMDMRED